MKIAIIDPSGFTPQYDHCLANALALQGCKVVFVTNQVKLQSWVQEITYERWEHFYRIAGKLSKGKFRAYSKGFEHLFDMESLLWRLKRIKPDIIHFQWLSFPFVDELFLRRFRKIAPLVLTVHDTEPFHGLPSSRLQLIRILSAYRMFDHYVVHTQYSKNNLLRQLLIPENRVSIIPHGVFDYYKKYIVDKEEKFFSPHFEKKKAILFFGLIKPYKGLDILLKAFSRLPEKLSKSAILQIVGYPKIPIEPYKILARELGIEKRTFWDLRFIEEKEVATYFAGAYAIVLPYRRIDQSGVLMVALAFGKPILASRVGGLEETIRNGIHGFLFEPNDVDSLARYMANILEDENKWSQMAREVERLAAENLSWSNIALQTVNLYREILNEGVQRKAWP